MNMYYLGSYSESGVTDCVPTYSSCITQFGLNALSSLPTLYHDTPVTVPSGTPYFTVQDKLYQDPNETTPIQTLTVASNNDPSGYFQFYKLNLADGWGDGANYWLCAYASAIGEVNGHAALIPGWDEVGDGCSGTYEELVFLIGPTCSSSTVPEPHIYLILGTLLACIGFVAYRKRQKA